MWQKNSMDACPLSLRGGRGRALRFFKIGFAWRGILSYLVMVALALDTTTTI
jgi:hypothetical protein